MVAADHLPFHRFALRFLVCCRGRTVESVICFAFDHRIGRHCFVDHCEARLSGGNHPEVHDDSLVLVGSFVSPMSIDRLLAVADYLHGCILVSVIVGELLDCRLCCLEREYSFVVWRFRGLIEC